jgi:hypothetical protein
MFTITTRMPINFKVKEEKRGVSKTRPRILDSEPGYGYTCFSYIQIVEN